VILMLLFPVRVSARVFQRTQSRVLPPIKTPTRAFTVGIRKRLVRSATPVNSSNSAPLAFDAPKEKSTPLRAHMWPILATSAAGGGLWSGIFALMPNVSPAIASVLSVAGPLCFFGMQLAGLNAIKTITQNKSVGELSALPFVSLATNCVVWTAYGVLTKDPTVLIPNLSGLGFGLYYTYVFQKYASYSLIKYYSGALLICSTVGAFIFFFPAEEARAYIGYLGCTLAIVLMSSPLAALGTVLRTKSTASMPFAQSIATFMNALSWSGYGLLIAKDPVLVVPNALGLLAAIFQLSLFARFGIGKPVVAAAQAAQAAQAASVSASKSTGATLSANRPKMP